MNRVSLLFCVLISSIAFSQQAIQKHFRFSNQANATVGEHARSVYSLPTGNVLVAGTFYNTTGKTYILKMNKNLDSLLLTDVTGTTVGDIVKFFTNNNGKTAVVHIPSYGKISISEVDTTTLQLSNTFTVNHMNGLNYNMRAHLQLSNNAHVVSYAQNGDDGCKLDCFNAGSTTNIFTKIYASTVVDVRSILEDNNAIVVAGYKKNANFRYDFFISKIDMNTGADIWAKTIVRDMYFRDPAIGLVKSGNNYLVCGSTASASSIVPTVVEFNANGDSLNSYSAITYNGKEINTGYLTAFFKQNNNIYAKAHIQTKATTPNGNDVVYGEMAVASIGANGSINNIIGFNDFPVYQFDSFGGYNGTYCYTNDATSISDSAIVLVGNGRYQKAGEYLLSGDSYIVKINSTTLSVNDNYLQKKQTILYPNPVQDNLFVTSEIVGLLRITDICGKSILNFSIKQGQQNLNISELSKGIYFARTSSEVFRIIKD